MKSNRFVASVKRRGLLRHPVRASRERVQTTDFAYKLLQAQALKAGETRAESIAITSAYVLLLRYISAVWGPCLLFSSGDIPTASSGILPR